MAQRSTLAARMGQNRWSQLRMVFAQYHTFMERRRGCHPGPRQDAGKVTSQSRSCRIGEALKAQNLPPDF